MGDHPGKSWCTGGDGGGGPGFPGLPLPSCRVSWSPLSSTPKIEEVLRHRTQKVCSMGISPWVSPLPPPPPPPPPHPHPNSLQYGNLALGVRIALIIALLLVGSSLCLHKTGFKKICQSGASFFPDPMTQGCLGKKCLGGGGGGGGGREGEGEH